MSTVTTNFQFTLPAINNAIDANIWGGQLNGNNTNLDGYLLGVDTGNIGSTAPTIPATAAATAGMVWINNTSGAGGVWPVQIYDGTNWVTTGMLDTTNHIYSNVGNLAINVQTFTTAGTYTPSVGMSYCIVEAVGGGGGGGGLIGDATIVMSYAAGGGGGGGYAKQIFTSGQIGAGQAVNVGAGGTATGATGGTGGSTLFGFGGALLNVSGGIGGNGLNLPPANSSLVVVTGGNGGTSVGNLGFLNINGNPGDNGMALYTATSAPNRSFAIGGNGGGTPLGPTIRGAVSVAPPDGSAGIPATGGYGSGGSGAIVLNSLLNSSLGGQGAPGYIIITEYI